MERRRAVRGRGRRRPRQADQGRGNEEGEDLGEGRESRGSRTPTCFVQSIMFVVILTLGTFLGSDCRSFD